LYWQVTSCKTGSNALVHTRSSSLAEGDFGPLDAERASVRV
jgi:hypothetical protein